MTTWTIHQRRDGARYWPVRRSDGITQHWNLAHCATVEQAAASLAQVVGAESVTVSREHL
jgi:hypothetical protein